MIYVRSGYVNLDNGQARNVGENGYGWSRTSNSSTNAYRLNFNPTDVNMTGTNRYNGFPLRHSARAVPIFPPSTATAVEVYLHIKKEDGVPHLQLQVLPSLTQL